MFIGTFYCNTHTLYSKGGNVIVLGELGEVYDEDFGGWMTIDAQPTGTPLYGLYCPNVFIKGKIRLADTTLDQIADGPTYGRILKTDISAGHILLSSTVGTLDDIDDGENYKRIAATYISAGKIVLAGLDSTITEKMFTDGDTKAIIEAWRKAGDVTYIDGGKIYAGSITALGAVTAGSFNLGSGKFVVDAQGNLSATTATIDGTINGYDLEDFQKYNDDLWDQVNNPQTGVDARLLVIEGNIQNNHIITDTWLNTNGDSGTFTSADGKTITVTSGIITGGL